jgi:hypothetical protein
LGGSPGVSWVRLQSHLPPRSYPTGETGNLEIAFRVYAAHYAGGINHGQE